ncbi:DUF3969 family protein [Enterococcus sp. LJL128]
MELKMSVTYKEEVERMVLINFLGFIEAIATKALSIDDAHIYFFSPYTVRVVMDKGINEEIITLLKKSTELEDIEALIPEKLEEILEDYKKTAILLLKQTSHPNDIYLGDIKDWIDDD